MNWREPDYEVEETAEERNWPQERWTWNNEKTGSMVTEPTACPVCKISNRDNHYDRQNDICPTYEAARSDQ